MASLQYSLPDVEGVQNRELSAQDLTVGRSEGNALILVDDSISRHHATIRKTEKGYLLVDNDSANGTYVNGNKIADHLLVDGDEIRFGKTPVLYSDPPDPEATVRIDTHELEEQMKIEQAKHAAKEAGQEMPAEPLAVSQPPAEAAPSAPQEPVAAPPPAAPEPAAPAPPEPAAPAPPPPPQPSAPPSPPAPPAPVASPPPPPVPKAAVPPPPPPKPAQAPPPPQRSAPPPPPKPTHAAPPPPPARSRSAPPRAVQISTGPAPSGAPAGFWIRLLAYILDGLIIGVIMTLIYVPAGILIAVLGRKSPGLAVAVSVLTVLLSTVLSIGYILYFWAKKGATPGKKIFGLVIVRDDGVNPPGWGKAAMRLLGYIVSGMIMYIGFIMIAFTENKRGLHDMIAGTTVVKTK